MTSGSRPRILLVTSNGAGMGHLSRQLAVGLALGEEADCAIFSLSVGAPVVDGHGIPVEYCPSYERGWMPRRSWNTYLSDRLVAITRELAIDVVLFDGVAPYPGIAFARALLPKVAFVWARRGMWRPETSVTQLRRASIFDLIVEPGDLAQAADWGPTASRNDATRTPPVSMLEVFEPLPRSEAAVALGLDPDRRTVLVTLGSGRLGDSRGPGAVVLDTLLTDPEWQIGVTKSAIALSGPEVDGRVVEITGVYPLVRYLSAFDAVVSAAGYNAVHEFIPANLATLLVPNAATRTDDQVARADELERRGLVLTAKEDDSGALAAAARALSDPEVRTRLSAGCRELPPSARMGGARRTGELLVELAGSFEPSWRRRASRWMRIADERWRLEAKARLGPERTDRVRRLLGRPPVDGPAAEMGVQIVESEREFLAGAAEHPAPLLITAEATRAAVALGPPVEHVVAGSSPGYRAERLQIVHRFYRVVGSAHNN